MYAIALSILCSISLCCAIAPTNLHKSYSFTHHREQWGDRTFRFGLNMEHGLGSHAYDADERYVGQPTQYYQAYESALAMLEGHPVGSTFHTLANSIIATQDGTRGTLEVTGTLEATIAHCFAEYKVIPLGIPGDMSLYVGVPIGRLGFSDVVWRDRTETIAPQDVQTRGLITQNIRSFARNNAGISTESYVYTGAGDVTAQVKWSHRYIQYNKSLQSVLLHGRFGILMPIGKERSEDNAMELALTHDGTWGVPLAGGIELDLGGGVHIGADINMLLLASTTKEVRLKSHQYQTDRLIPNKGLATKSYGPKWQFNLYGQYRGFDPRVVFTVGYQMHKYDEDKLYPQDSSVSSLIVNTAESLEESRSHNLILHTSYNAHAANIEGRYTPYVAVQCKIPFGGQRMVSSYAMSAEVGLHF